MAVPQHIAIIMDGNGRWAKNNGKPRTYGHYRGSQRIRDIAIKAEAMGVKALTLYAFSTENWKRSQEEVSYLMSLPAMLFKTFINELMEKDIRVLTIGDLSRFPEATQKVMYDAIERTKDNKSMDLVLAVNYGGRQDIVRAARAYAQDVVEGKRANDLTEHDFDDYLYTAGLPPVDLLIRTSLDYRISNFLLWQISYTEMYFVDVYWPDFDEVQLEKAVEAFEHRQRRFGGRLEK